MNRPRYERPTLIRHVAGMMNKYARAQALKPLAAIDGVPVAKLVEQFGSPLFVFSERTLVSRQHELKHALALRFPKSQLAWSYKTNYLDAVCRVFHREGSWAEVVSELEFDKARRLGVPGEHILFNGPFKPESALDKAFAAGARVHLDHFDELSRAESVAEKRGLRPKVSLRLNMAVPGTPAWTRFGFNLEALDTGADAPPTIFLEAGRALVDDAGFLVTTVHATKRLPDGRRALVLDAGVNTLVTSAWYKHDVVPAQDFQGTPEPTVMVGPLCMNIDVLRDHLLFPPVNVGDRLVFKSVGAYNVTQWMQFIVERPAVVLVSRAGEPAVIRRRESLETLVAQEAMPPWLA